MNGKDFKTALGKQLFCRFTFHSGRLSLSKSPTHKSTTQTYMPMPSIAHTLDGRLLCASECAYDEPSQLYMDGAGWSGGQSPVRITKHVNSCLVGRTIDGIVIAFRGTQPNSAMDWLQDAAIHMKKDVHDIPGRIHAGFYHGAMNLYEPLKAILLDLLETAVLEATTPSFGSSSSSCRSGNNKSEIVHKPLPRILLTGHSKGGSLASLIAVILDSDPDLPNVHYVASFGAARVGDATFQAYFNATIRQRSYENNLDIIPFLPPGKEDYDAMGHDMKKVVNK
jgi:hypothetical protein